MRGLALLAVVVGSLAAFSSGPGATQDSGPDWVRKPSSDDLMAAWPTSALNRGKSGKATLVCQTNIRGGLENCRVEDETPPGEGFGAAALLLAPSFQMKPQIKDGKPQTSSVRIPISFASSGGDGGLGGPSVSMLISPPWKSAPSFADMAAAWPKGATGVKEARVSMRCRITKENRLSLCDVLTENPRAKGFGASARKLSPLFELAVDPRTMGGKKDIYVNIAVSFVDPETPGARTVAHPKWIKGPDMRQLAIFPDEAAQKGLTKGLGVADCAVAANGSLIDCKVSREDPVGLGFGPAAVRVAEVMQMSPWTEDGRPVDGARIKLPIRFEKTPDTPAAPAAKAD